MESVSAPNGHTGSHASLCHAVEAVNKALKATYRISRTASPAMRRRWTQSRLAETSVLAAVAHHLCDSCPLALSAVSPRARLCVEVYSEPQRGGSRLALCPRGTQMVRVLHHGSAALDGEALQSLQWWLDRASVPLEVHSGECTGDLAITAGSLTQLSGVVLSSLVQRVRFSAPVLTQLQRLELCGPALQRLATVAPQMTGVRALVVREARDSSFAVVQHFAALRDFSAEGSFTTVDLAACRSAALLENVSLSSQRLRTVRGVGGCARLAALDLCGPLHASIAVECAAVPTLKKLRIQRAALTVTPVSWTHDRIIEVDFSHCERFIEPSSLSVLSQLRHLTAKASGLRTLAGLTACSSLETANFAHCSHLRSLAGLAGAPKLRWLSATHSAVQDLAGLCACPALRTLRLTGCGLLHDLSPLAGAPALRFLDARHSGARELGELHRCPLLESVCVDHCGALASLTPLSGAPRLRHLSAAHSGVCVLDSLAACPLLERVDLSFCDHLDSTTALAGAPRLRTLCLTGSRVTALGPLFLCPCLADVDVSLCSGLRSLAPLAGAPQLRGLVAGGSGVADLQGLCGCPSLQLVDVSGCECLQSLTGLAGAPQLRSINAAGSGVQSLVGLNACPALLTLTLRGCASLTTIFPLNLMPQVLVIMAEAS